MSAVREGEFKRHLQAEMEMLRLLYAFYHKNYARHSPYQHVNLGDLKVTNHPAHQDLYIRGFGANYSLGLCKPTWWILLLNISIKRQRNCWAFPFVQNHLF